MSYFFIKLQYFLCEFMYSVFLEGINAFYIFPYSLLPRMMIYYGVI